VTQRHVLYLALGTGAILAFFSAGLHKCAIDAGEAEVRVACRTICTLSDKAQSGEGVGGAMGKLALSFKGVACGAMSDEAPELLSCRELLMPRGLSIADYHCLRDAESLAEARDCGVL